MRIILADDSPIFRARLFTLLDDLDEVEIVGQAESGPGTLDIIRRTNPEAAIIDVHMPGLTGIQVLEEIRETRPDLLVIMITNYPCQQYQERCRKAGADYVFDKSREIDKIIEVFSHRPDKAPPLMKDVP